MTDNLASAPPNPKVFISYSWDSSEHKSWVLQLANLLRGDAIDAILDQSHLNFGGRTPEFMERSVRDSRRVLVICTEGYKDRFDGRKGGAGYEGHIITAEILKSVGANKFIPILRQGNWRNAVPTALDGVFGVDLSTDSTEEAYRKLVRHLHEVNNVCPLGPRPDWLEAGEQTTSVALALGQSTPVITPQEYWEERKRLGDSELISKIWQMPRWSIWSRPEQFKKARFRNLDHCVDFVASQRVRSGSSWWSQCPRFSNAPEKGIESVVHGKEVTDNGIKHLEVWRLFQSGQFVNNLALSVIPQLGANSTHVLEILFMTTAVFEFVGRMVDHKILTDRVAIYFGLEKVAGRQLSWPQDNLGMSNRVDANAWCQEESIPIDKFYSAKELIANRRVLALNVAVEIYARFGWSNPPIDDLKAAQQTTFGPPIHP